MIILDTARELLELTDKINAQERGSFNDILYQQYDRLAGFDAIAALCRALLARDAALRELARKACAYDDAIQASANDPDKMASYCTAEGDDLDSLYAAWINAARRALADEP